MKTTELTLQLPEDEAQFLENYAKEHAISLGDLVTRYVRLLKRIPHPDNLHFTGTVPPDIDVREMYREHIEKKHR
jgi:hypothetical protein